jgi:hypothetical protein
MLKNLIDFQLPYVLWLMEGNALYDFIYVFDQKKWRFSLKDNLPRTNFYFLPGCHVPKKKICFTIKRKFYDEETRKKFTASYFFVTADELYLESGWPVRKYYVSQFKSLKYFVQLFQSSKCGHRVKF